jgi:hypothetical protein
MNIQTSADLMSKKIGISMNRIFPAPLESQNPILVAIMRNVRALSVFGLVLTTTVAQAAKPGAAEASYRADHSADDYSTCLQWQRDDNFSLNHRTYGGTAVPVFSPKCGLRAAEVIGQHKMITDWMPDPGAATTLAKTIMTDALFHNQNYDADKRWSRCQNWRTLMAHALQVAGYQFYPNTINYYETPRCGLSVINNYASERIYIWMPEAQLEQVPADGLTDKVCITKRNSYGVPVLANTPCNIHSLAGSIGNTVTSIGSDPRGAALSIDGVFVAHTPAILVLDQEMNRSKAFTVLVVKDGYLSGTISVSNGDQLMVKLTPTNNSAP